MTKYELDEFGEWEIKEEVYAGSRKLARALAEEWVWGCESYRKATIQEA